MAASILHRATGLANLTFAFALTAWLVAIALGPDAYERLEAFALSVIGRLLLFGWTLALAYHVLNGVRHLAWDLGLGFKPATAEATAWLTLAGSVALTLAVWAAAYWAGS